MKKIIVPLSVLFSVQVIAQNVGIGTAAPDARLQINHRSSVATGLALIDSSSNAAGSLMFRNVSNTKKMLLGGVANSDFNNGQYLNIRSDSAYAATFKGNGYVGIGNTDPVHRLDVNGDINTTGAVRVNGNAGTNGQVLRSNGDGTISWGDMSEYKNIATFDLGSANWTVPAGVTKIWVEAWGGGGGGNSYLGGGGGAYISGIIPVTAGNTVAVTVGFYGTGDYSSAQAGQTSSVSYGPILLQAFGGQGAAYSSGTAFAGGGGYYSVSSGFQSFIGDWGADGNSGKINILQASATQFYEVCDGGRGGNAGNTITTGGNGTYIIQNTATATSLKTTNGTAGKAPGGGGGSGSSSLVPSAIFFPGNQGGMGMVIIHY